VEPFPLRDYMGPHVGPLTAIDCTGACLRVTVERSTVRESVRGCGSVDCEPLANGWLSMRLSQGGRREFEIKAESLKRVDRDLRQC
jgi:hypothetical protein